MDSTIRDRRCNGAGENSNIEHFPRTVAGGDSGVMYADAVVSGLVIVAVHKIAPCFMSTWVSSIHNGKCISLPPRLDGLLSGGSLETVIEHCYAIQGRVGDRLKKSGYREDFANGLLDMFPRLLMKTGRPRATFFASSPMTLLFSDRDISKT